MAINSLVAGLVGVLVPVTLDKSRIDPAVSSAVFVTTMTDVMGFFSFLGLAALFFWFANRLKERGFAARSTAVPNLHLTKVAFGCRTIDSLQKRVAARTP